MSVDFVDALVGWRILHCKAFTNATPLSYVNRVTALQGFERPRDVENAIYLFPESVFTTLKSSSSKLPDVAQVALMSSNLQRDSIRGMRDYAKV
jgi:hypothetical protein